MEETYEVGDIAKILTKIQKKKKAAAQGSTLLTNLFKQIPCCENNESFYQKYLAGQLGSGSESKAAEAEQDEDDSSNEEDDEVDSAGEDSSNGSDDEEGESDDNDEEEQSDLSKKKMEKTDGTPKDRRTIFVGNIPVKVDRKKLMREFEEFGDIDSVRIRSLAPSQPGVSKQLVGKTMDVHERRENYNAYIVFTSREAAERATEKNGEVLDGFHLRVDLTRDDKKNDSKKSIFLGGLPYDISEEDVRSAFEDFGEMESVRLIRDNATGLGKGIGFIVFKDPSSVALALKMNSQKVQGRRIRVKPTENNPARKKGSSGQDKESTTQRWRRLDQKGRKRMRYKMKLKKRKTQDTATQGKTMNVQTGDGGHKGAAQERTSDGRTISQKPGDVPRKPSSAPGNPRKEWTKGNVRPETGASRGSTERRPGGWRQKFGNHQQGIQEFSGKKMKFDK